MSLREKAKATFDKLFHQAYWWTSRHSPDKIRNHEVGKPGEMVERLSAEDREALQHLRAEDISDNNISKESVFLAAEQANYLSWEYYTRMIKEAKLAFDKKILKDPPRADRKKY